MVLKLFFIFDKTTFSTIWGEALKTANEQQE